jgi:hypothetical protein
VTQIPAQVMQRTCQPKSEHQVETYHRTRVAPMLKSWPQLKRTCTAMILTTVMLGKQMA